MRRGILFMILQLACYLALGCASSDGILSKSFHAGICHYQSDGGKPFINPHTVTMNVVSGMTTEYYATTEDKTIRINTLNGEIYIDEKYAGNSLSSVIEHCTPRRVHEYMPRFVLLPNIDYDDMEGYPLLDNSLQIREFNHSCPTSLSDDESDNTVVDYLISTSTVEYICDENNRPVVKYVYRNHNKVKPYLSTLYTYSGEFLVETVEINSENNDIDIHQWRYDENGFELESSRIYDGITATERYLHKDEMLLGTMYIREFTDAFHKKQFYEVSRTIFTDAEPSIFEISLIRAKTIFDKSDKSWASKMDNEEFVKSYLYNPQKQFDRQHLLTHFKEYRLDPEYAVLEKDDYPSYYDTPFPFVHPDYAHPSRPFWMSPTEVTQAEFRDRMGYNPSYFAACGDSCPVENVTWFQALDYANRRSEAEGLETCYILTGCTERNASCKNVEFRGLDCRGYRLPTDEEWRYMATAFNPPSAQANRDSDVNGLFARTSSIEQIAWISSNSDVQYEGCRLLTRNVETCNDNLSAEELICIGPHPVGTKAPDANGLYDFYGNVYEWVWDWFGYARRSGDSLGPDRGICRIMRGGSVFTDTDDYAVYRPGCYLPDMGGSVLGFRLVRTL